MENSEHIEEYLGGAKEARSHPAWSSRQMLEQRALFLARLSTEDMLQVVRSAGSAAPHDPPLGCCHS